MLLTAKYSMTTIFNADFQGYSGWSDTNPGFGDSATISNYWYYGTSGPNWLGYRAWSTATPGIKYRTGVADGTIELKYKSPYPTSDPYDLRIIYRYVDSSNYRYLLLSHLGSVVTVKQFTCVAGTHSDTGLLNQTIAISGNYGTEYQDWLLVRMVVKGTKQVVLRVENLNSGASIESSDLTLGSTFQTATGVGFYITGDPNWVRAPGGSFYDHIPVVADSLVLDYMRLDDVSIFPVVSVGGVRINGTTGVQAPIRTTGSLLIGGGHARKDGFAIRGSLLVGASYYSPRSDGGLILGGTASINHTSLSIGGLTLGGTTRNETNGGLTLGGTATITSVYRNPIVGGLKIEGNKYANGFPYRRQITIPANTFVEPTDYYLGLRLLGIDEVIQVTDSAGNIITHQVRSHCVGGFTHLFFPAYIDNPTINNNWYLYYKEEIYV